MSEHTPGEWEAVKEPGGGYAIVSNQEYPFGVTYFVATVGGEFPEEDARLIASAPTLLAENRTLRRANEIEVEARQLALADAGKAEKTIRRLKTFCDEFIWDEENPAKYATQAEIMEELQDTIRDFATYMDYLPKNEDTQILASKIHHLASLGQHPVCPLCGGSGGGGESHLQCPRCGGTGEAGVELRKLTGDEIARVDAKNEPLPTITHLVDPGPHCEHQWERIGDGESGRVCIKCRQAESFTAREGWHVVDLTAEEVDSGAVEITDERPGI